MNQEECANCKFGLSRERTKPVVRHRPPEKEEFIICRRYPKHILHEPGDWCAEYKECE